MGSMLHRSKALQAIDDRRGGRCVCERHPQCCQERDGVLHLNTGTLKPSGGCRIGKSCNFKAAFARHGLEISDSPSVVQSVRFIERCVGIPSNLDSALTLIELEPDASLTVVDPSSLVISSSTYLSPIGWIWVNTSLTSDGWPILNDSRSQKSLTVRNCSPDFSRSSASRHMDQEEEFASMVEFVEASSSRELCVATVTLFPLSLQIAAG